MNKPFTRGIELTDHHDWLKELETTPKETECHSVYIATPKSTPEEAASTSE